MHTFGKKCRILIEYVILRKFANERKWVIYITRDANPSHSEQKHIWTKRLQRLCLIYIPGSSAWGSQVFQLVESLATMNERSEELLEEEWKKLVSTVIKDHCTSPEYINLFSQHRLSMWIITLHFWCWRSLWSCDPTTLSQFLLLLCSQHPSGISMQSDRSLDLKSWLFFVNCMPFPCCS